MLSHRTILDWIVIALFVIPAVASFAMRSVAWIVEDFCTMRERITRAPDKARQELHEQDQAAQQS